MVISNNRYPFLDIVLNINNCTATIPFSALMSLFSIEIITLVTIYVNVRIAVCPCLPYNN